MVTDQAWRNIIAGCESCAAVLVALVRARGLTLDVGRCPACEKRGGKWEWTQRLSMSGLTGPSQWSDGSMRQMPPTDAQRDASVDEDFLRSRGWITQRVKDSPATVRIHAKRACSECVAPGPEVKCEDCEGRGYPLRQYMVIFPDGSNGWDCRSCHGSGTVTGPPHPTGRDIRDLGRVLLDALPTTSDAHGGDPVSRQAIAVEADRLQDLGDQFGEWLALALVGKLDTAADALAEAAMQTSWMYLSADALAAMVTSRCDQPRRLSPLAP